MKKYILRAENAPLRKDVIDINHRLRWKVTNIVQNWLAMYSGKK